MSKKYKDMTPEERNALKAANETVSSQFQAARNAAHASHIAPIVDQAELDADHAATQRRINARHRSSFAAGIDDLHAKKPADKHGPGIRS